MAFNSSSNNFYTGPIQYEYSDSSDDEPSLKEQLRNFDKISMTGQLFVICSAKRRRKRKDRIVKVLFDNNFVPKQISWGGGSRHIDFNDILYVSWGHWTPVFDAKRDQLEEKMCFSVVGKQKILDIQAQSKEVAELWVKGLRKLCNQTDEKSDKLAKQAFESGNLPGHRLGHGMTESEKAKKEREKRTKSLMLLQQDLFATTTRVVFRNLEEERIWDITRSLKERFNAKSLYELSLKEDVPWRQWNDWVREKIVAFLREKNRVDAKDDEKKENDQKRANMEPGQKGDEDEDADQQRLLVEILTNWGLIQYKNVLVDENGFDDVLDWRDITEDDLRNDMKFKLGHARKFIRKTREYFDLRDEQNQDEGGEGMLKAFV